MHTIDHVIGGARVASENRGPVFNPATGEQTGSVAFATAAQVDHAVAVAKEAFASWRRASLGQRAGILFRFRELVVAHRAELAEAITAEHGKVLSDADGEVGRGLESIEFACGLGQLLKGGASRQVSTGIDVREVLEPVGVVAGITPFNFPVMVPLWMIPNALACGNAFVLKPSEKDPSASMLLADLLAEAGLPTGVFNVVHGDRGAVDRILEHPDIAAVSFVGSTPVARSIYERATAAGKRVQALGGAKNHMVVLPDANVDTAADAAVSAAYGSAGERCMAVSVVVPVGPIADELVGAIADRLGKLQIGPGVDPSSEMGPLVTREHRERVSSYVAGAPAEGATVVVDGRERAFEGDGFFLGASLLDHVTPAMRAYQDEIFGPVLAVVRAESYEDALALVNTNAYGNGAAIFTDSGAAARQFEVDVQAGMIGVNVPIPVPVAQYSFGGWKSSLFGDSHMYGPEGIHFYTRTKVVTSRWPTNPSGGVNLRFPGGAH